MGDVFVVPVEDADWVDDPHEWVAAARRRWPEANVQVGGLPREPTAALAVLRDAAGYGMEVVLSSDRQSLSIDRGDVATMADVVTWWLARVPAGPPELRLYDGPSADTYLVVGLETPQSEILAFLNRPG
jgi:hypothetical protein